MSEDLKPPALKKYSYQALINHTHQSFTGTESKMESWQRNEIWASRIEISGGALAFLDFEGNIFKAFGPNHWRDIAQLVDPIKK